MAKTALPDLDLPTFSRRLAGVSPEPLPPGVVEALHAHYRELCRWQPRLSLIGPGTAGEVVERHYGEALAALPLIPPAAAGEDADPTSPARPVLVDVGSGAGFPGLVLAAARPGYAVTLVEARQRKWAFLQAAARRMALPCSCLGARVDHPPPAGLPLDIDLVTVRALKLPRGAQRLLIDRLRPAGRFLLWQGAEEPEVPPDLTLGRQLPLAGSERRRIVELKRAPIRSAEDRWAPS